MADRKWKAIEESERQKKRMIYSQQKKISASMCGSDAKLSAVGALNLIEDSLTELTGELQIDGLTVIKEYNAILVFVKNHVQFFKRIGWNEKITVESFVSAKSPARFYIDTCIKDENQEIVVYSRVELCSLDLETKRPRKIATVGVDERIEIHPPYCEVEFKKNEEYDFTHEETVKVRTSNIDYLHHTNNIEYIRFLADTFSIAELEEHPIKEMEIHYMDQTYEGDELQIYSCRDKQESVFEIRKDSQPILRCEMVF